MSASIFPVFDCTTVVENHSDGEFLFDLIYGILDELCARQNVLQLKTFVAECDFEFPEEGDVPQPVSFEIDSALDIVTKLSSALAMSRADRNSTVPLSAVCQELEDLRKTLEEGRKYTEKFCFVVS